MYDVNYEITLGECGFVTGAEYSADVGDGGTLQTCVWKAQFSAAMRTAGV